MIKSIFTIFSILALLTISQATMFRVQNSDMELKTDENGQITLTYIQGSGYTVPVYFRKVLPQAMNIIVSLYSSNMLLTQNCLNFNTYYCNQYASCNRDTSKAYNVNYPFLSAQGNLANTDVIVDINAWSLAYGAPTLIATSCSSNMGGVYGAGTFGILGLGMNGNARRSFQPVVSGFSVYFSFGAFRLEFNPNLNFPKNLIARVQTNADWAIPNVESIAIGTSVNRLAGVNAIWDINSDAIGLPLALYNTFVPALATYGIYCPAGAYYQPICTFNQALPLLSIKSDAATTITLIPQMWALNQSGNQFKLNFKALSPSMAGLNFINQDYQNTIVLGNTVLGTYYHYFSLGESAVYMYQPL